MRSRTLLTIAAVALAGPLAAQVDVTVPAHRRSAPPTPTAPLTPRVRSAPPRLRLAVGPLDVAALVAEDDARGDAVAPWRIGVPVALGTSLERAPEGWSVVPEGLLWSAEVRAIGAFGVRLGFEDLDLPEGAELWIRAAKPRGRVEGPIRGKGPFGHGRYWSGELVGERFEIAYFLPAGAEGMGSFALPTVQYLYRDPDAVEPEPAFLGSCQEDVMCYPTWHPLHEATIRYSYVDGSTFVCSATLIDSIALDETPYVLTANHCIASEAAAETFNGRFFYETLSCGGANATDTTVLNASLLQTLAYNDGDLTLLELLGALPASALWAGWTTAAVPNGTDLVGIHHPNGSRKKISFGAKTNNPPADPTLFHGVTWSLGTIDSGSSGSGLYVEGTQLLVGALSRSTPPLGCANPAGPSAYGKLKWWYGNEPSLQALLDEGTDDAFEPDDDCASAVSVGAGTHSGLVVKSGSEDWYVVQVPAGGRLDVDLRHVDAWGDLDLELYEACAAAAVASALGAEDHKSLSLTNRSAGPTDVRIRVWLGDGDDDTRNTYDLEVSIRARAPQIHF